MDGNWLILYFFVMNWSYLFNLYGRKDGFFFESMDGLSWLHGSMVITKLW